MQHRPVLHKVIAHYDQDNAVIRISGCAEALNLTADQVRESLQVLCDARFIQASPVAEGEDVALQRVLPAAREVLADPRQTAGELEPSLCPPPEPMKLRPAYEQVVLGGFRQTGDTV